MNCATKHRCKLARPVDSVGAVVVLEHCGDAPLGSVDGRGAGKLAATFNRRVDPVVAHHRVDGARTVALEGIAKNLLDLTLGLGDVKNLGGRARGGER